MPAVKDKASNSTGRERAEGRGGVGQRAAERWVTERPPWWSTRETDGRASVDRTGRLTHGIAPIASRDYSSKYPSSTAYTVSEELGGLVSGLHN